MCGIAGIYQFNQESPSRDAIFRITNAMAHRGPDADGLVISGPVALGHRRLAIIDLSPAGNQPAYSSNGRFCGVFNGEIYNFREIRATLTGHSFKSTGDTEVLMEGWARWGLDLLPKLKGMFSFAILDQQTRDLYIVRDRLGVKPLYYSHTAAAFSFASEIRSLLTVHTGKPKVSEAALFSYFSYQSVVGEQSIIEGIRELPAGHYLKISNNQVSQHVWWQIKRQTLPDSLSYASAKKQIRQLLLQAVEQRLVSDVPVGAFLSGGIDSSAVVGLMAEVSSRPPETFTVGFTESEYDESSYASLVAKKFGTHHHVIVQKPDYMLEQLLPALNAMDTPSGDGINSYVVSKAIREAGITVALSGIGGDELFAGYPFFQQYKKLRNRQLAWKVGTPFRQLLATLLPSSNSRNERLRQLFRLNNCSIEEVYPLLRQILPPSFTRKVSNLNGADPAKKILTAYPNLHQFPQYTQVSIADLLIYTQHTLLKDTDQMSMAVSLEVREPFFDHELIEYVCQLPDEWKNPVYPKKLLVESLEGLLPEEIVFRKKQGFIFPWEQWMKNELRSFCQERIHSLCERSFIRPEVLRSWWSRFLKGDPGIRWMEIWIFIIIDYWLEKNDC